MRVPLPAARITTERDIKIPLITFSLRYVDIIVPLLFTYGLVLNSDKFLVNADA
ncbi:hypothetical protein GCM10011501_27220 [Thalassotalea profundi]|uniref:Uncharacterized protein n=1 Tax=Thalassotalea profundi TaxID=2036687 RepID=A0ABQ3IXQ6_9GAMM|nr:hypothetical protein GCM10011501_27220 [Thalassotalea profundi]